MGFRDGIVVGADAVPLARGLVLYKDLRDSSGGGGLISCVVRGSNWRGSDGQRVELGFTTA